MTDKSGTNPSATPTESGGTTNPAELTQLLKAAGDELRLEVLRALSTDSFGVLELCKLFDAKQSGMSHHLKVLAKAQLVTTRKEGNSIFYRRAVTSTEDPLASIKASIFKSVDQLSISKVSRENLDSIYSQRSLTSKTFFSENASKFKQQQDLIVAFDVYAKHVSETLENSALPAYEIALEIGPGTGEYLNVLAKKFTQVTALDNSEEMLAESRKRCDALNLSNIDFVHNDTTHCRDIQNTVDCAIISMVLHHTPSPQHIFEDVATALKPKGVMIVCDLCQHDQDWTRDACGDLWLGFAPEDLCRWANASGLTEGQSSYFALRNGFQIQIREFIKH